MNTWYFEASQNNFENDGIPINNQSSSMYNVINRIRKDAIHG